MRPSPSSFATLTLLLAVAGLAMSGCTQSMLATQNMPSAPDGTCNAVGGAYHIPRRLLTVKVAENTASSGIYSINVKKDQLVSEPETYCLDFLTSAFSDDRIGIKRSGNLLLERIYTSADDKSRDIALAAIQAGGDLIAAGRARSLLRDGDADDANQDAVPLAELPFDPFNKREVMEVNAAIRAYGYCIYLDARTDPYVPTWSNQSMCKTGKNNYPRQTGMDEDAQRFRLGRELMQSGVVYRPELSHRLIILRKRDPGNPREAWALAATEYVTMPNAAPLFALGINRAIFVKAETDVKFKHGLLRDITVHKPSELNAAVDIPLYAAQVALSIPAASIKIFENEANNRIKLMETNAALIETLREMKQERQTDTAIANGATVVPGGGAGQNGRSGSADLSANRLVAYEACLQNAELIGSESPEESCRAVTKGQ
ncbi:MAG: hypothetical protein RLQ73_09475 [Hoeflea sp. D1-CHI-28]